MARVLDELLTERPVAMLCLQLDGLLTAALLLLVMRATYAVQRKGKLDGEASLVITLLFFVNCYFVLRNGRTLVGMRRRRLSLRKRDVFDLLSHLVIFYFWGLIVQGEGSRTGVTFRCVAAFTLGLCWVKVLAFITALHMKFAVYVQALVHIADALQSFICILAIVIGAFANVSGVVCLYTYIQCPRFCFVCVYFYFLPRSFIDISLFCGRINNLRCSGSCSRRRWTSAAEAAEETTSTTTTTTTTI